MLWHCTTLHLIASTSAVPLSYAPTLVNALKSCPQCKVIYFRMYRRGMGNGGRWGNTLMKEDCSGTLGMTHQAKAVSFALGTVHVWKHRPLSPEIAYFHHHSFITGLFLQQLFLPQNVVNTKTSFSATDREVLFLAKMELDKSVGVPSHQSSLKWIHCGTRWNLFARN